MGNEKSTCELSGNEKSESSLPNLEAVIKMAKKKIIIDKKKSNQKKALRLPMPPKGGDFKDKKKYTRKRKHKKDHNED